MTTTCQAISIGVSRRGAVSGRTFAHTSYVWAGVCTGKRKLEVKEPRTARYCAVRGAILVRDGDGSSGYPGNVRGACIDPATRPIVVAVTANSIASPIIEVSEIMRPWPGAGRSAGKSAWRDSSGGGTAICGIATSGN